MPTYTYRARDISGNSVSGMIALTSEKAAREYLRLNEIFVTSLGERGEKQQVKGSLMGRRIKLPDLVVFSRQFASMITAGVPIVQALESLADQTESPVLQQALGIRGPE